MSEYFCFRYTGPMSAVASLLSEFHSTSKRAKIQIFRGFAGALAIIFLPMLGWATLPNIKNFTIAGDYGKRSFIK